MSDTMILHLTVTFPGGTWPAPDGTLRRFERRLGTAHLPQVGQPMSLCDHPSRTEGRSLRSSYFSRNVREVWWEGSIPHVEFPVLIVEPDERWLTFIAEWSYEHPRPPAELWVFSEDPGPLLLDAGWRQVG